jgi:hypothetical protein
MAAANTDKFRKMKSQFSTTLASGITDSVTTIPCNSLAGVPTGTAVTLTIDRVDANGTATSDKQERVVGVVSTNSLTDCLRNVDGDTAQVHSAGAVVEMIWDADTWNDALDGILAEHSQAGAHTTDTIAEKTAGAGVTVDGLLIKDGAPNYDGWIPSGETWTFSSWDDIGDVSTGVITVPTDATTKYQAGMRVSVTQSTGGTKTGIITKVEATALTIFFNTDYTLVDEAITAPKYSTMKCPFGFDANPEKWKVEKLDTTNREQTNPTAGTWYNTGSLNITIPIGIWDTTFICAGLVDSDGDEISQKITLSTANNSESDKKWSGLFYVGGSGVTISGTHVLHRRNIITNASASDIYYVNQMTDKTIGAAKAMYLFNESSTMVIRAICAYL